MGLDSWGNWLSGVEISNSTCIDFKRKARLRSCDHFYHFLPLYVEGPVLCGMGVFT